MIEILNFCTDRQDPLPADNGDGFRVLNESSGNMNTHRKTNKNEIQENAKYFNTDQRVVFVQLRVILSRDIFYCSLTIHNRMSIRPNNHTLVIIRTQH